VALSNWVRLLAHREIALPAGIVGVGFGQPLHNGEAVGIGFERGFKIALRHMHGLLKSMISGGMRKRLDIGRISEIAAAVAIPLTLHGGSGTDDGDFKKAISAGITIVHISTELRLAWRRGIEAALAGNSDEVVPYKIYGNSVSAMMAVAEERLRLFNAR
jgi:fructose/tagatose bisphosphate aldolase